MCHSKIHSCEHLSSFAGQQENAFNEIKTRNRTGGFVPLLHADADRLFLQAKVATLAELDGKRFRNCIVAPQADVEESIWIFEKEEDDSDAEVMQKACKCLATLIS